MALFLMALGHRIVEVAAMYYYDCPACVLFLFIPIHVCTYLIIILIEVVGRVVITPKLPQVISKSDTRAIQT